MKGRKVSAKLPESWLPSWDEQYQRWRESMRCEGQGTGADWLRYLTRIALEQVKREHY